MTQQFPMKAISLTQPWASLMAIGAKRYETRSWSTSYRGTLLIAAAKGWVADDRDLLREEPFLSELSLELGAQMERLVDQLRGHIIAAVELVDCVRVDGRLPNPMFFAHRGEPRPEPGRYEIDFGNYSHGRFAWITRNARRLSTPVPAKGRLGLWDLQPSTRAMVDEMIDA